MVAVFDLRVLCDCVGAHKVNTIDDFFHVGFTRDRHAEFMARPIIVTAVELCSPPVVDFLLNYGADLSKEHEGTYMYDAACSHLSCEK